MMRSEQKYRTNGTAALKPSYSTQSAHSTSFMAFAGKRPSSHAVSTRLETKPQRRFSDVVVDILQRSEMVCSLLFEDVKGVPYRMLSRSDIATLTSASAALAVVAIVLGS